MPNIMDYLDWRGDLSMLRDPFNEVDNLLLCKLCTIDLTDVVPPSGSGLTIREAAERYFDVHGDKDVRLGLFLPRELLPMLRRLADSVRFGDLLLSDYVRRIDLDLQEQLGAMTVSLPDETRFIVFSGTDDTLVAWKENLNMGIDGAVPAQTDAAEYLRAAAEKSPGRLRIGGHSKGGNLAVYASLHNPPTVQDRIINIFNNDGPGFLFPVLETPEYQRIRPKIITLVPQYSLVGMLLSHEEEYEIVNSFETGIDAHNGFTWEVLGTKFVRCEDFALGSKLFDNAVHEWANGLDMQQRQQFIEAVYDILTSTGARTLTDLAEHKIRNSLELAQSFRQDPKTKEILKQTMDMLIKEYVNSAKSAFPMPKNPLSSVLKKKREDGPN